MHVCIGCRDGHSGEKTTGGMQWRTEGQVLAHVQGVWCCSMEGDSSLPSTLSCALCTVISRLELTRCVEPMTQACSCYMKCIRGASLTLPRPTFAVPAICGNGLGAWLGIYIEKECQTFWNIATDPKLSNAETWEVPLTTKEVADRTGRGLSEKPLLIK